MSDQRHPNDPSLTSWVDVPAGSHFPIQNLPFGTFLRPQDSGPRVGVAIGDTVLDLTACADSGLFGQQFRELCSGGGKLNAVIAQGREHLAGLRGEVSRLLRSENPELRDSADLKAKTLLPQSDAVMLLPVEIGDYTDFYSSREHATNVGTMLRGAENALQPNWLWLPVAYHGRASSIVASGAPVRRPLGQTKGEGAPAPTYGPSKALDFELEMGVVIGAGNDMGEPIPPSRAAEHACGMVLVNDWSARDLQRWEYVPLGPFLAKNFGTTISPWLVTLDALEPFRTEGPKQDPAPLAHLATAGNPTYDIHLEATLTSASLREPVVLCRTNYRHLYWNFLQQIAHHTSNGCPMRPGDLLASGTISGPEVESRGCLLERTWGGQQPVPLPGGEVLRFLRDGDTLTITGWCEGPNYRVGFGTATGTILPALA